jgi:ribosomal protein S18 acetylase RimI-like enzyme
MADKIKGEWVSNYFNGKRGHQMLVATNLDQVVGFNQILISEDQLIIDLIATDKNQQGLGLGRDLILFAQAQNPKCKILKVGTQISNKASIKFYEKVGFKIDEFKYVLHHHGC